MKKHFFMPNRINMVNIMLLVVFLSGVFAFATDKQDKTLTKVSKKNTKQTKNSTWDKTFPKSNKVIHEKVKYPNRYGITISADMYMPKDIDKTKKYPAIVIGTPYAGVKEQGAGIYAQALAERGFVTIAFDESYNGESSGKPRRISSPDIFVEDFSAGVDFLGTRPFVDREKIGAIGICGSGAFALTAAQVDRRIKAIATASMYDMSRVIRNGWKDSMTADERNKVLDKLGKQRWKDFENGSPKIAPGFPSKPMDKIPEGLDPISSEFFEYYAMKRGHHPNAHGPFTNTSNMAFMNFPLLNYIDIISPRPILFIIGEKAHSRYFTEDAYKRAGEPKELVIIPGARHIDLYDRTDMIPFDKLTTFFNKYLQVSKNPDHRNISATDVSQKNKAITESKKMSNKVLIAYYSWSPRKNTQAVAKEIQKLTGGDLFKIEMDKPYSTEYRSVLKEAKRDLTSNARPKIKPFDKKVNSYDVIFIGSPIWYGTYAPPVATFISEKDLSGKTVIPFSTHGGGGSARYAADIKKLCPKSKVLQEFTYYGPDIENADAKIAEWIKQLNLQK